MSDGLRIAVAGATGLIGQAILAEASRDQQLRVLALKRRIATDPHQENVESFVSDPSNWNEGLAAFRPEVLVCALGTTWRKAGRDEVAFRAVDHDLVLDVARSALERGASRMVLISSVGADTASRSLYLRVKGDTERNLASLGFSRLDILRPGLLRGERGSERRVVERAAIALSPLTDGVLHGQLRKYRSIAAVEVAQAALTLSHRAASRVTIHHHDAIRAAAHAWPSKVRN